MGRLTKGDDAARSLGGPRRVRRTQSREAVREEPKVEEPGDNSGVRTQSSHLETPLLVEHVRGSGRIKRSKSSDSSNSRTPVLVEQLRGPSRIKRSKSRPAAAQSSTQGARPPEPPSFPTSSSSHSTASSPSYSLHANPKAIKQRVRRTRSFDSTSSSQSHGKGLRNGALRPGAVPTRVDSNPRRPGGKGLRRTRSRSSEREANNDEQRVSTSSNGGITQSSDARAVAAKPANIAVRAPPLGAPQTAELLPPSHHTPREAPDTLMADDTENDKSSSHESFQEEQQQEEQDVLLATSRDSPQQENGSSSIIHDEETALVEAYVVTENETKDESPNEQQTSLSSFIPKTTGERWFCFGVLTLIAFVILGAVISGIVCGLGSCGGGGDDAAPATQDPIPLTVQPTSTAPTSAAPTPSPSSERPPTVLDNLFLPVPTVQAESTSTTVPTMLGEPSSTDYVAVPLLEETVTILLPQSTAEDIEPTGPGDEPSPQALAFQWLAENYDTIRQQSTQDSGRNLQESLEQWRLQQLFAMATYYYSMDGPNWIELQDWLNPTVPECQWNVNNTLEFPYPELNGDTPVVCSPTGQVTQLFWNKEQPDDNLLDGTIPPEIALLSSLAVLGVEGEIMGDVPFVDFLPVEQLTSMSKLKFLFFSDCQRYSGTIPSLIAEIPNLKKLRLNNNDLSGHIPSEFGLVTKLRELRLDENNISGPVPSQLGLLTLLSVLDLTGNPRLSGTLPEELWCERDRDYLKVDCTRVMCPESCPSSTANPTTASPSMDSNSSAAATNSSGLVSFPLFDGEEILLPTYTVDSINNNPTSPQALALEWLADNYGRILAQDDSNQLEGWRKQQAFVMATLYYSLEGDKWRPEMKNNWLKGTISECAWDGGMPYQGNPEKYMYKGDDTPIVCSDKGQVTQLYLNYLNALRGPNGWDLGDLYSSPIEGSLPAELELLPALEVLLIRTTIFAIRLEDIFPLQQLPSIPNLRAIGEYHGDTKGTIPPELGTISSLEFIMLINNDIFGTIPTQLSLATRLWGIYLSQNDLSGEIPSQFGLLTMLERLALRLNVNLSGTIPSELGLLTALTHLELDYTNVSGLIPAELCLRKDEFERFDVPPTCFCPSPTNAPTSAPTQDSDTQFVELPLGTTRASISLPSHTVETINQNASSPQARAMEWLADNFYSIVNHQGSDQLELLELEDWRKQQLFALATLFYSLEGSKWMPEYTENWLESTVSECEWDSSMDAYPNDFELMHLRNDTPIACSDTGQVIQLHLNYLNAGPVGGWEIEEVYSSPIAGTFPPELELLTDLEVLLVGVTKFATRLEDLFPIQQRSSLPSLRSLGVYHVGTTGTIPAMFWSISSLEHLNVINSEISGTIPTQLSLATKLRGIQLEENKLTGGIPSELGLLTMLERLTLHENANLTGTVPTELGMLTALTYLNLWYTKLSGMIPAELCLRQEEFEHFQFPDTCFCPGPKNETTN